ncbi:MAG TPA: hypothetical protein VFT12_06275 [Thermoanaerobaculia bacterium]|nr:hypothetical protein [Thermoanaerobaculia bacterium]
MRMLFPALLFSLVAIPTFADSMPRDAKIDALAADLHAISRIGAVAKDLRDNRQVILAIVDENIEALREKRDDGTYRWASLQREEGGRVADEKPVQKVETEKELQTITVTAPNAYRILVIAPRKRNLVSANNRIFVRNIFVESTGFDGTTTTRHELPVNVWVNPGDTHGVALPDIGRSVRATVELGVESGNKAGVAQVALIEAKLVDDPTSPYFPAVKRLLQLREIAAADQIQRGALKTISDEAILGIPGEMEARAAEQQRAIDERKTLLESGQMKGAVVAGDATPDVLHELSAIQRLLSGTLDEQADARRRLQALTEALTPQVEKPAI